MKSKIIFGINLSHDTSCAAVIDGEVKIAIEEERLNRIRHCNGKTPFGKIIPFLSINYCCKALGIEPNDVDLWVTNACFPGAVYILRSQLVGIPDSKIIEVEKPGHHLAHAYSTFFASPYKESAVLVYDVNGSIHNNQKENYSIYFGKNITLDTVKTDFLELGELSIAELYVLYAAILQLSPKKDGDYGDDDSLRSGGKLMGYAAQYFNKELINNNVTPLQKIFGKNNGKLEYDSLPDIYEEENHHYVIKIQKLISYLKNIGKTEKIAHNADFNTMFGFGIKNEVKWNYRKSSLKEGENILFAYEAQLLLEEIIIKLANLSYDLTKCKNLCVAGGTMLNVVACNRILKETPFENLFVQPGATDGGNALGAAFYGYYKHFGLNGRFYLDNTYKTYLGDYHTSNEIQEALNKSWVYPFTHKKIDNEQNQINNLVEHLKNNKVVCIYKGRSEFGPRALGNRSFLASPRKAAMLNYMNEIKGREWYRPVAPIILEEELHDYFDSPFKKSPFMTINAHCLDHTKELAPAICHVDGSARVQTVSLEYHPFLYKLLKTFKEKSGLPPILINTSFNVEEPIVETPAFAINTFLGTNQMVKALLLENYLLEVDDLEN